jgi:hypothetical protein
MLSPVWNPPAYQVVTIDDIISFLPSVFSEPSKLALAPPSGAGTSELAR